jgi:predicted alpha/beta superfamily hydrolase
MNLRTIVPLFVVAAAAACMHAEAPPPPQATPPGSAAPLVVGETFSMESKILGERRVINVYLPPRYRQGVDRFPVLYMPDGGIDEDFPHVMGAIDVSIKNEVIQPMLVVGIQNVERRHDLVGPTSVAEEQKAAPHAGGAERFRQFLRDELKPYIAAHYRFTAQSAIVGESLAGLFVLETLLVDPALFDAYIAVDPSVWWNRQALVRSAAARFAAWSAGKKTLFVTTSEEPSSQAGIAILVAALEATPPPGLVWHYVPLPDEHHSTIFPVSANRAFRMLFAPVTHAN